MAGKLLQTLALASILLNIIVLAANETCRREEPCESGMCTVTTECVHGSCSDKGVCYCQGCWNGESCDVYENFNKPYFKQSQFDAYLSTAPVNGQHVFTAEAFDDDDSEWPSNLPCVNVRYAIVEGNSEFAFMIDATDGSVYVQNAAVLTPGQYKLTIAASNEQVSGQPQETSSLATLTVHYEESAQPKNGAEFSTLLGEGQDTKAHHRSKRAVPAEVIPENVTFTLIKTGKYENVTTMRVGDKVSFRLMIHFPTGTTDMLVELFTPDNDTTVMKLCNPTIAHVGSNLKDSFDFARAAPQLDARDNGFIYDRAVLDLGNVTNTESDTADYESSMIYIDYDAVMQYNPSVVNNTKYWVSAGAEYNNEYEIWVGQAAFASLIDDMLAPREPKFNLTAPSEIALDSSGVFLVDMFISNPSTSVRVDAFAPLNTTSIMSVCGISITDTDKNYACLPKEAYKAVFSKSDSGEGNWHGTLDLDIITNAGSREDTSVQQDDRITVAILAHMLEDGNAVDKTHNFAVAVEVGGELIWTASAPVKVIAPPTLPEMTETPKFAIKPVTSTTAFIGRPSVIELEMITPENTVSEYDLEVITPDNDTVSFKVCKVSVIYSGENVACVREKSVEFFQDDNSSTTNRAVLKLGYIRNYAIVNKTEANVVRFEIVVQAINTTSYAVGERYWVTMGMNFTETKMWVGQQAFTIEEPADDEPRTNPSYEMKYSFGSDHVTVGDSREILYEMQTVPGAVYQPAYVEVIMPDNVTTDGGKAPLFSICKFRLVSAGKNVPCINATGATEAITYEDKFGTGVYDKARLSLGAICNTGRYDSTDENKVIFAVTVRVENHPVLENGTKDWVSLGMMLTNDTMWVGQVAMFALVDTFIASNPSGIPPYLGLEMTSNITGDIPVGYYVTHELYLKIPPRSSIGYKVNVTSHSPDLSVCALRLMKTGSHVPCMESVKATYTTFESSQRHEGAYIDLGAITSFGPESWVVNATNVFADDTVLLEVTTKLWTDSGSHSFDVLVTMSDGITDTVSGTVVATADHSQVNSNYTVYGPPLVTFFMVDIYDTEAENATTEIGRGEVKRFISDVVIEGEFLSQVIVKFFAPLDNTGADVEICGAQLIGVGANIPCLLKSDVKPTYEIKSSGAVTDVATLDLGYVCMTPLEPITNDTNKLRFEGIMKINPETTLASVKVSSSLRVGDTYISMSDLPLTIVDSPTQPDFTYINGTNATIPALEFNLTAENMTIAQRMAVPVILTLPANTTGHTLVDIKLPVNDSAHMTVEGIKVISAGKNIACFYDFTNLNTSFISTQNTSQNDGAYVDFGTLANTGSTYRSGQFEPEDDQIVIEFEIQMADSEINEDKSWHEISTAVEYGGIIVLVSEYIQVIRNSTEKPELKLIAECDVTTPLSPDDLLQINGVLKHLNTSTAEGINVTASFYLPPYVTYLSLNYSNLEATVDMADGSIVRVQFPRVFFTDMVFFGILLQVLSNASAPLSLMDAITPYETGSTMHYRDVSMYTEGEFFTTELDDVSFRVSAQPETACSDALGMESMAIKDCQISGSVSPDASKLPKHGRLNSASSGWSPFRRNGKHNEQRHLQVYFGNRTKVSHIKIQHPGSYTSEHVSELQIYYSDDGYAWLPGEKLIPNSLTYTTADLPVLTPRESRYIRLYVLKNTGAETDLVGLQVEFFGCMTSADVVDPCPASTAPVPAQEYTDRMFLSTGTEVFVCDAEPDIDLTMHCVTSANGDDWKMLDRTVGNVIGFNPVTDELFAIATDRVTYLLSLDRGLTWSCILPDTWTAAKARCVQPIPVPWTVDPNLQAAQPVAAYTQDSWGATAAGIFYNSGSWNLRLDWASCC